MGPTGPSKVTRCILDGGSQSSFISSKRETLELSVIEESDVILSVYESHKLAEKKRLVGFQLQGIRTGNSVDVIALEPEHILRVNTIPHEVEPVICTRKLPLADLKEPSPHLPIEILNGGDH